MQLEWTRITTDPDDPQVRREQLRAKRAGLRPPPAPLVPPVASRPYGLAQQRLSEYLELVADHARPASGRRQLASLDEFDKLITS